MATNLFTPIVNDRTRSVHFFNGRLLTGEDLTEEQRGQRAVHELLGEARGDGVVRGLEVSVDRDSTLAAPLVTVTAGLAVNRKGTPLLLTADTQVRLVRSSDSSSATKPAAFSDCTPPQAGVYVAGAGVYLLTLCSASAATGSAPVLGLGGQPSGCNSRYAVDAVQFRLIEVPLSDADRGDPAHLRNVVAYRCFAADPAWSSDPLAAASPTLVDTLRPRSLTDCDVPLATLYWTATGGLVWIDVWSVRRRAGRDEALAEAVRAQFQQQIGEEAARNPSPMTLAAGDVFRLLPPAGLLPIAVGTPSRTFAYAEFFREITYKPPVFMESGALSLLLRDAARCPPIDVTSREMVWLYFLRENLQLHDAGVANRTWIVFANANVPFYGEPRFDRSHFDYSNFV